MIFDLFARLTDLGLLIFFVGKIESHSRMLRLVLKECIHSHIEANTKTNFKA